MSNGGHVVGVGLENVPLRKDYWCVSAGDLDQVLGLVFFQRDCSTTRPNQPPPSGSMQGIPIPPPVRQEK